jgi:hypothetical protein
MYELQGKFPFSVFFDDHRQCDNDYWAAIVSLRGNDIDGIVSYRREYHPLDGYMPIGEIQANATLLFAVSKLLGGSNEKTKSPEKLIEEINKAEFTKQYGKGNILAYCSPMPWKLVVEEDKYVRVSSAKDKFISHYQRDEASQALLGGRFMVAVSKVFAPLQIKIAQEARVLAARLA